MNKILAQGAETIIYLVSSKNSQLTKSSLGVGQTGKIPNNQKPIKS